MEAYPFWLWWFCWHLLLQQVHEGRLRLPPLFIVCAEKYEKLAGIITTILLMIILDRSDAYPEEAYF